MDGLPLEELELSVRSYNVLKRAGIDNFEELNALTYEQLIEMRLLGSKGFREVIKKLKELGGDDKLERMEINDVYTEDKYIEKNNTETDNKIEIEDSESKKKDGNEKQIEETEEKIMDDLNKNNDNVVEEIDPEEYLQEWKESGEESYYTYLFNKYNTEKANGNEELAAHIYKVYEEAHELEQQWMGTADEEKMGDIEREKKKQREDLEREDSINSYPEETESIKNVKKVEEESMDLSDKTIEELEAIIADNEGTIAGNDKEIKERLIQKILGQQQTIAKQQEEIDRLKSQKVIK